MRGFSLVELSIVLVILGLLVGGILAGQSLIRASELRSINTDMARFQTATNAFRDKYFGLPGDISNATAIWGISSACSGALVTGTCNGNGDGQLLPSSANSSSEMFQYWRQLALAGLIEGNYNGITGSLGNRDTILGTNAPASKISGVGYSIEYIAPISGNASIYLWDGSYRNQYYIGAQNPGSPPNLVAFKPEEAWNMDVKIDDGNPAAGNLRMQRKSYRPNCTTTDIPTTTDYNLGYSAAACNIIYLSGN